MSSRTFAVQGELALSLADPTARQILFERSTSRDASVRDATSAIILAVRERGDAALFDLARRYDSARLAAIEVPGSVAEEALSQLEPGLRSAMERAARNIRAAHSAAEILPFMVETEPGIRITRRPDPLRRVGVYAPGGRAAYPSSVLMGVIPARVAGVEEVVLCSPPGPDGLPSVSVLAAAALSGVDRIFAVGGAGAIAAMAFGTDSVPRVDKIVGPGNAYVAEAKLQLGGFVAFDSPAGPSELLLLADDSANPAGCAHEILAQAEHDPMAAVAVVCTSEQLARDILRAVESLLLLQDRKEVILSSLQSRGALLWTTSLSAMTSFASDYAPEHLSIVLRDGEQAAAAIRTAGTIFVGATSSVAFGDYMTGANHVLPTGGLSRSYAGLSTLDFVRWTTVQSVSASAAAALCDDVATFALAERLPAHAAAALHAGGGVPGGRETER